MTLIQHPVLLENELVKLVPLDSSHFDGLLLSAKKPEVWTYLSFSGMDQEALKTELRSAILRRATGEEYAFTIFDKLTGKITGSTRFLNIAPGHRKLEIGWTWYDPSYWGSGHNIACKLLLLSYAFETVGCIRVQFQVHDENKRSRAAVEKLGAKFEGILRKDRIRDNGMIRNTAMYSIIDDEWEDAKQRLTMRLKAHQ